MVTTIDSEIEIGTGGLSIDRIGNFYLADFGRILGDRESMGTKVLKRTPDGEISLFSEGLEGASGNEFDSEGNLFQSSIRGSTIYKINVDGKKEVLAWEGIVEPVGLTIDEEQNVYVANCGGNSIQKISKDGTSTKFVEQHELLIGPNGITLDEERNLYVANFDNGDVIRISTHGKVSRLATLPGGNNGHLIYHRGNLYVVARSAHQIYVVSLTGKVKLLAGSGEKGARDGSLSECSFCFPNDIKASTDGNSLYVNQIADLRSDGMKLYPILIRHGVRVAVF